MLLKGRSVLWPRLRIGTRPSKLALVQIELLSKALEHAHPGIRDRLEIVIFETPGDKDRSQLMEGLGGRGVFTDLLDQAVADGQVDIAVHAMKDMPPSLQAPLVLAATLERANPQEVLVSASGKPLAELPEGAVFGSSSIRRQAMVRRLRPDVQFDLLRGNVEERVAQVMSRPLDGTILAHAGLARLGLLHHVAERFTYDQLPPDPAQGAIGMVAHRDNFVARRILQAVDHMPTTQAIKAERAVLSALPSPDALAIGALATVHENRLLLRATLVNRDGSYSWSEQAEGPAQDAHAIGRFTGLSLRPQASQVLSA